MLVIQNATQKQISRRLRRDILHLKIDLPSAPILEGEATMYNCFDAPLCYSRMSFVVYRCISTPLPPRFRASFAHPLSPARRRKRLQHSSFLHWGHSIYLLLLHQLHWLHPQSYSMYECSLSQNTIENVQCPVIFCTAE